MDVQLSNVEKLAGLCEKYGLAVILLLVLLLALILIGRMLLRGDLVPRRFLERMEEDRDHLQAMLEKERQQMIAPVLEGMSRARREREEGGGPRALEEQGGGVEDTRHQIRDTPTGG